jgi:agmatine deiminase
MKMKTYVSMCICFFFFVWTGYDSNSEIVGQILNSEKRVPAEWESHAATWMQWPGQWESVMRPAFADIINVIQDYEPVHLLTSSESEKTEAEAFLANHGVPKTNITWHIIPIDNAWMRDNGPVYVTNGDTMCVQNWKFDAWGGNFGGNIPYENDDMVPDHVAEYLGMTVEDHQDYILERGNLEFNGAGTLVLNWDCQNDRNPGMAEAEHEAILMGAFGLHQIIWAYGHDPGEGTTGHIDGTARFIDSNTIVIADFESQIEFDRLATDCEEAGLEVIRYDGDMNWLVGNGFIIAGIENELTQIASFFPGRDVQLVDISTIMNEGGGIHCVTNDQPSGEPVSTVNNPSDAAGSWMLSHNYPNPFNSSTHIRFQAEHSGQVELIVYDLSGRVVRRLFDGLLGRGTHEYRWNGTNDAGKPVVSGIYFYTLRSGRVYETRRMTLLK